MLPSKRRRSTRPARAGMLLCVAVVSALPGCTAAAQEGAVDKAAALKSPAVRAAIVACRSDKAKLCPDATPGGGRIVRCLAAKLDELTPACRDALKQARDALANAGSVAPRAPPQ